MKKYHILQIVLTKTERDLINSSEKGHDAVERHANHLKCSFGKESWKKVRIQDYDHVANITAENQEDGFRIGNSPDRNEGHPQVELIEEGFYSVSAGDIFIDVETKEAFGVAGVGFQKLDVDSTEEHTVKNFK
jgi:hypothetical protein|tara:strand:- start:39 stop:437 length:399 start_codon:yes stop_codon:yes gene_type:complete